MTKSITIFALLLLVAAGCRKEDMADQARQDTMDESQFFADGQSARPLVAGTVPRGHPPIHDSVFAVTQSPSDLEATAFPFDKTDPQAMRAHIEAGKAKFDIFCSVCHGRLGNGQGMIVQRGFPRPPSYYTARLRNAPVGHFYNVITNGYGAMYSYGDRIKPDDRWNIVAYIQALQASAKDDQGQPIIDPEISRTSTTQPAR